MDEQEDEIAHAACYQEKEKARIVAQISNSPWTPACLLRLLGFVGEAAFAVLTPDCSLHSERCCAYNRAGSFAPSRPDVTEGAYFELATHGVKFRIETMPMVDN